MKWKKIATAVLYAVQTPLGVLTGFWFAVEKYTEGLILTVVMTVIEVGAVFTWLDAQTEQVAESIAGKKDGGE